MIIVGYQCLCIRLLLDPAILCLYNPYKKVNLLPQVFHIILNDLLPLLVHAQHLFAFIHVHLHPIDVILLLHQATLHLHLPHQLVYLVQTRKEQTHVL